MVKCFHLLKGLPSFGLPFGFETESISLLDVFSHFRQGCEKANGSLQKSLGYSLGKGEPFGATRRSVRI